jgi:putative serine protease PepD
MLLGAAVLLAGTSGVTGAWVANQLDEDTVSSGQALPGLDRSSLADIVAKVQSSVVSIKTGSGEGSGVVIDSQGDVLTNNHVVATANGGGVTVTSSHGDSTRATIVGTDPRSDLAVVRVADRTGLTVAVFGDSDAIRVGDSVLALGSPLGLEGSVTAGIVSAKDRTIQVSEGQSISGMIQTDAAVNPGNSGGALVDLTGKVIGINSAIATSGNGNGNIGVGFAIPSNTAERVADQLIAGERVTHPYLGVSVGDADGGALVQAVTAGSPAERAGLRKGDLITRIGDRAVNSADDLVAAVQGGKVGDRLGVTYTREGETRHATVTLAEAPQ